MLELAVVALRHISNMILADFLNKEDRVWKKDFHVLVSLVESHGLARTTNLNWKLTNWKLTHFIPCN